MEVTGITPSGRLVTVRLEGSGKEAVQSVIGGYPGVAPTEDSQFLIYNEDGHLYGMQPNPRATQLLCQHRPQEEVHGFALVVSFETLEKVLREPEST